MMNTTGGREVSFGGGSNCIFAHSQTSGLVVKPVDLCGVHYCILQARLVRDTGAITGHARTRKQFESAVTSFSRIFF